MRILPPGRPGKWTRLARTQASWWEMAVAAIAVLVPWVALWVSSGSGGPDPSSLTFLGMLAVVAAGSGWLGFRGRPVRGTLAVAIPPLAYVGWRGATAPVVDANLWPAAIVILVFYLAPPCAAATAAAWSVRELIQRRARDAS